MPSKSTKKTRKKNNGKQPKKKRTENKFAFNANPWHHHHPTHPHHSSTPPLYFYMKCLACRGCNVCWLSRCASFPVPTRPPSFESFHAASCMRVRGVESCPQILRASIPSRQFAVAISWFFVFLFLCFFVFCHSPQTTASRVCSSRWDNDIFCISFFLDRPVAIFYPENQIHLYFRVYDGASFCFSNLPRCSDTYSEK